MILAPLLHMCYLLHLSTVRLASRSTNCCTFSQAAASFPCLFLPSVLPITAEPQHCHIQCHHNFLLLQSCPSGSSPRPPIPRCLGSAVWQLLLQGVATLFLGHL